VRDWPRPDDRKERHLSYALQWYGFAASAVLIWLALGLEAPLMRGNRTLLLVLACSCCPLRRGGLYAVGWRPEHSATTANFCPRRVPCRPSPTPGRPLVRSATATGASSIAGAAPVTPPAASGSS
jgi:hypothetical protein